MKREELKKQVAAAGEFNILSDSDESDPEIEAKIEARRQAKKEKNFALADQIRNELKSEGIELTDIPNGVRWKRI